MRRLLTRPPCTGRNVPCTANPFRGSWAPGEASSIPRDPHRPATSAGVPREQSAAGALNPLRCSTRLLDCYLSASSSSRRGVGANGTPPQQAQHQPHQHHPASKGLLSDMEAGRQGGYGLQSSHQQQQQQNKGQQGPGNSRLGPSSSNGPVPEDNIRQQMKLLQVRPGSRDFFMECRMCVGKYLGFKSLSISKGLPPLLAVAAFNREWFSNACRAR